MITYLPYPDPSKVRRTLEPTDRQASGLTAYRVLASEDGPLEKTIRMWQDDGPMLARYGVILDVFPSHGVFVPYLTGGPWSRPEWLTDEICASHRAHLKYVGLARHTAERINNAFDSVESWCGRNGFGRFWTVEEIQSIQRELNAQRVPEPKCPPAYEHFPEEANPEILWPF